MEPEFQMSSQKDITDNKCYEDNMSGINYNSLNS